MYVDGRLRGPFGETHKVSALPTLQFSCISVVGDITQCITMDAKVAGDLVYVVGKTRDELGASEYYEHFGYVGLNLPKVKPASFMKCYNALSRAVRKELIASCHGIYRGGLGIHLAMVAMAGELGVAVDLSRVPKTGAEKDHTILYSETPGRFIVTVDPRDRSALESTMDNIPCACIGTVCESPDFHVNGLDGNPLIRLPVSELKKAWKETFGRLV